MKTTHREHSKKELTTTQLEEHMDFFKVVGHAEDQTIIHFYSSSSSSGEVGCVSIPNHRQMGDEGLNDNLCGPAISMRRSK